MKVRSFLPLVVTVIVGCGWLILQRQSISTVEKETVLWRKRVDAAKQAIPKTPTPAAAPAKAAQENDYQTYDWGKLLVMLGENHNFGKDAAFHKKLRTLSLEEITAALDEISRLDIPETSRKKLSQLFLGFFAFQYPEMALTRFKGSPASHNAEMNEYLARALAFLAKKDPAKACAWLDDKIAGGEFVSKSLSELGTYRVTYERVLLRALFPTNLPAIEKRLMAMNEEEAVQATYNLAFDTLDKADPILVASLVRKTLPEERVMRFFEHEAALRFQTPKRITEYINKIQAAPAERSACVKSASLRIMLYLGDTNSASIEKIDALRTWVDANQPGSADLMTGNALGFAVTAQRMTFQEASDFALHYREKSTTDDILIGFLADGILCYSDQARKLAEKISDPQKREKVLKEIR